MDYKEKVIALLNSQELSKEQKEKLENIFPELKESEDESIRKGLINGFKECLEDCQYPKNAVKYWHNVEVDSILAWLEKQVEKESNPRYKYLEDLLTADDIHQMSMNEAMVEEAKSKAVNALSKLGISKLLGFEKQGKKKPHEWHSEDEQNLNAVLAFIEDEYLRRWLKDIIHTKYEQKVEPKFKVGDWITTTDEEGNVTTEKIIEFLGDKVRLIDINGLYSLWPKHELNYYHIWTINDANDGDVLAWDNSKCIALFKNIYDEDSFNSYGLVGHCTGIFEPRQSYHDIKGAHPATKEQCDLLFQKMREAGYEWDADKKELKKIEVASNEREDEKIKKEELKPQWKPTTKQMIELDHLISGCSCEIEIVKELQKQLYEITGKNLSTEEYND